jgi:putative intracellular protease/amidase
MKILMVLTSHDQLGNTGKKTGFWLEEFAAPYYAFKDAGADVTLVSPLGGQPPLDPKSDEPGSQTDATRRFKADAAAQAALASTGKLSDVSGHVKAADGSPLVKGKKVTGFTNTEEDAAQLTDIVPFLVEDMLVNNGGEYSKGADWAPYVVVDGKLITGQNPASSELAAQAVLRQLKGE